MVAKETGVSRSTVARYFALFGLQTASQQELSTDPFLVEKLRDCLIFLFALVESIAKRRGF